jgi:ketosteroid isomerase-like protein
MSAVTARFAGLFVAFILLLPLSCRSNSASSSGNSLNSLDAAAIKAVYRARTDAMNDYDANAYLATFAPDYVSTNVTGHHTDSHVFDSVKHWPKKGIETGVASLTRTLTGRGSPEPDILSVKSDGNTADVTVTWQTSHQSSGVDGRPYYYYRDYISDDKWEKLNGQWVEKSSQSMLDRVSWSFDPIPASERNALPLEK